MSNSESRDRNASFPLDVPYRIINMYSVKGDTILDPFGGLSTSTIAAIASERNSISVDIDKVFCEESELRILDSLNYINKYVNKRIKDHELYIESLPVEKQEKCYYNENMKCKVRTGQEVELSIKTVKSIERKEGLIEAEYN